MVNLPEMWPHQIEFIDKLRAALIEHRHVVACGVTGFGKSRIAKWLMASSLQRRVIRQNASGRVLFCVHRRGLVDNISEKLLEAPETPHGVIMSGRETDWSKRVQVASIDTLLAWKSQELDYNFDLVIYDECHSHLPKLQSFLAGHAESRERSVFHAPYVLGLSATPQCKGIGDVFRHIVQGPSGLWLQQQGYSAKFRYLAGDTKARTDLLVMQGGRITTDSQRSAVEGLEDGFVHDWLRFGEGRPTIGYFPFIAEAKAALEILRSRGIDARYVDGETPDAERRDLYRDLQRGWYPYLVNVGVTERGTDIPAVACVQLCVCIGVLTRLLQIIGRGARVHPGKTDCLVLDHGGNIRRFNTLWEDEISWDLSQSSTKDHEKKSRAVIECPSCGFMYRGGRCAICGYEPTANQRKKQGLVFDGTDLVPYERKQKSPTDWDREFASMVFQFARSNRTWKQLVGAYLRRARADGVKRSLPKVFKVGGKEHRTLPYGDPRGAMRVRDIYPFAASGHAR